MKHLRKQLEKLRKVKRKKYHILIHRIHRKHNISKKTLFYIKEYGPNANVPKTIIKESIKILILTSLICSIGGIALENIKEILAAIIPLVILLPALNDLVGNYGTILSSRFTTMLYTKKVTKDWHKSPELKKLLTQIFFLSIITAILSCIFALVVSAFSENAFNTVIAYKVILISLIDVLLLITILSIVAISLGFYFYKKKEDPVNLLIPITTSLADFGNMIVLAILVKIFF